MPKDCAQQMVEDSKGTIGINEAKKLIADFQEEQARGNSTVSLQDRINAKVDMAVKADKFDALQKQRSAVINHLVLTNKILPRIYGWKDRANGLRAYEVGLDTIADGKGGRDSIALRQNTNRYQYTGQLISALKKEKLWSVFSDKKQELGIMRELERIGKTSEQLKNMPRGETKEQERVAKIIDSVTSPMIDRANQSGAYINKLPGYIIKQGHNMMNIRRAGGTSATDAAANEKNANAYSEFISPLLNWQQMEKNEGQPINRKAYLRSLWSSLSSGMHLKPDADNSGFLGKGSNMAAKVSAARKLVFNNADDFQKYNDRFGQKDLKASVFSGINKMSDSIAMMEAMGTNPQNMHDKLVKRLKIEAKEEFKDGGVWGAIDRDWQWIHGDSRIPVSGRLAGIGQGIRNYNVLAMLGSALSSHVTNLVGGPAEMRYQGINPLVAFSSQFSHMAENVVSKDKKDVMGQFGVGFSRLSGSLHSQLGEGGDIPGALAGFAHTFLTINGEHIEQDAHSEAMASMMAHHEAKLSGKSYESLPDETKRLFDLYGIKPAEWDGIRKNPITVNGNKYLLPDSARMIPDEEMAKIAGTDNKATLDRYRTDLENRWHSHFVDRVSYATIKPDAKQMSLLMQGTRPGTAIGEFARFAAQFKTLPTAILGKTVNRDFRGRASSLDRLSSIAGFAAMTTLAGYGGYTASQLLEGKTPPDPTKWKTLEAAITKGAGLGILTDYIFGESMAGRSPLDTLAGPTLGKASALLEMYDKMKDISAQAALKGEEPDFGKVKTDTIYNLKTLIPGNNLLYLKGLFNYLVVYKMNEMVNPGYVDRMKQRLKTNSGQSFYVPISQ